MSPTDPTRDFDPATADGPAPDSALDAGLAAAFGGDSGTTAHFPGKDERVGAILGGKYKLIEEIGEGGMGSVYMAQQTEPVKRLVAVKVIKAGMDSKAVLARFEAERQALAMMDHPNIAKVLDAGTTENGRPFFVMELVKGVPITQYCDERKLTPKQRLELFVPVCHAIQHAHQKGVIHRDIKPSNVLIALYDDKPVPKVIDFGVAKAAGQSLTDKTLVTGFGAVVGTPEYMSPEQANLNNLDIDTRSDVYSLGVLLYELLTGTTPADVSAPLNDTEVLEVLRIVREVEAPPPSHRLSNSTTLTDVAANRGTEPKTLGRQYRSELDWVLLKALEKDRDRRYASATAFAADIERHLNNELVDARPPTRGYRLRKFYHRHRPQVIAVSLVFLTLVAGIMGTTLGLVEARQARADEAERADGERVAKELAENRLAQIEKGVDLFAGLLRGINPRHQAKGGPTLFQQLRERAVKVADQLDAEAVGDRLAVARLQKTLGDTLQELGAPHDAVRVLGKAVATRKAVLGAEHRDTLNAANSLAMAHADSGNRPAGIALFRETLAVAEATFGFDHADTLAAASNLASAYSENHDFDSALPLYERCVAAHSTSLGPRDAGTRAVKNNLASAYQKIGRYDLAVPHLEEVYEVAKDDLGPTHAETLAVMSNLAAAYAGTGNRARAIPLYEQALAAKRSELGSAHVSTVASMSGLGRLDWDDGKMDRALPLLEEAAATALGSGHPNTLLITGNLGGAYRAAGKQAESLAVFEQAFAAGRDTLGLADADTLTAANNLAWAYQHVGARQTSLPFHSLAATGIVNSHGQHPFAERIVTGAIAAHEGAGKHERTESWRRYRAGVAKSRFGLASDAYAGELAALGENLLRQQKWSAAERVLRECLAIRADRQPDASITLDTRVALGAALLGRQMYADAERLLVKTYAELAVNPDSRLRLAEAADALVALYTATNKPDEVKKWRAERAKFPPEVAPLPRPAK